MATAYTSLLGLALPVTGELSGTWGDTVNTSITALLDTSIAGTTTISSDADVTLTTTTGAANTSRQAVLLWTAGGTATRTITAPAQSKTYIVVNKTSSTQSIKLVGAGPTTGVTIIAGESAVCAWNGVDFIKVSSSVPNAAGSNTQVQFNSGGVFAGSANLTWDGSFLTAASIKDTALTSTRITFAGASGLLSDSANLTWSGTVLGTTGFTASSDSSFTSTGALTISKGTTAERPTPTSGMLRFNTTTTEFEGYNGATWASVGGAALSNDTVTTSNIYPLSAAATSGTASTLYTSNAKFLYKPSTGELQASEIVATNGLLVNATTVSANYTVGTGYNAFSVGPVTIGAGISVTISSGQRWLVQ
jgi:hypothetical protein